MSESQSPIFFKQWGSVPGVGKRKNGDERLKAEPGMKCQSAQIWQEFK